MTSDRRELEPAFVLHRRAYRNTSLVVEAFSREHGRIGLVARGARSGRGRQAGLLQPFRPLLLSWSGRGDLFTLRGAEAGGRAPGLGGRGYLSGFYLNELLMRLTHRHDPHPALHDDYQATLTILAEAEEPEPVLRRFERHLLEQLGYGLELGHDTFGAPVQAGRLYCYHPERGPEPVSECGGDGVQVHGETLHALARDRLETPAQLSEAKRLMRAILAVHLGDRPLQSRSLFRRGADD